MREKAQVSLLDEQAQTNSGQLNDLGLVKEIDPFDPKIGLIVNHLKKRITTGFSKTARENLLQVAADDRYSKDNRFTALYAVSKWHSSMGNAKLALDFAKQADLLLAWHKRDLKWRLYLSWCFASVGDGRNAQKALPILPAVRKQKSLLDLARSNAVYALNKTDNDRYRLKYINRVFRRAGLSEIGLIDPSRPLHVDNFRANKVTEIKSDVMVSVLVPAYNCTASLHHAIDGLLNQSWVNIEIIVADDASTDGSADLVASYMKRDLRVRYVRLQKNQGSYVARNAALHLAKGDFITTHDTDDWSHPQKIELQVKPLIANRKLACSSSFWSRTDENFFFTGKTENKELLVHENASSYMYRRQNVISLGGWDAVRISADSELNRRVAATYGGRVQKVSEYAPLSFAITQQESLTRAGPTHGRTILHGVRRCYKESASFWLEKNKKQPYNVQRVPSLRIGGYAGGRSYPVPSMILPDRKPHEAYNTMIIARTIQGYQTTEDLILFLKKYRSALGLTGVLTWADFWDDPFATPHPELRQMAQDHYIHFVSPGVSVDTANVLIWDALPLTSIMDMPPVLTPQAAAANAYLRTSEALNPIMRAQVEDTVMGAFHLPSIWLSTEAEFLELSRRGQEARAI